MRRLALVAVVLAGCYRPAGEQACRVTCDNNGGLCPDGLTCDGHVCTLPGGGCGEEPADAAHDADDASLPIDGRPQGMCYGTLVSVCPPPMVTQDLYVSAFTMIDTGGAECDFHSTTGPAQMPVCVLMRNKITISMGQTLRAYGTEPLVLFAATAMDIEGTIDVSSTGGGPLGQGAGADMAPCQAAGNGTDAGGGGGGGLAVGGGPGGSGNALSSGGGAGGGIAVTSYLRGGCPGGSGDGKFVGKARGGGAVELISPNTITLAGGINASGAAGGGGASAIDTTTPGGGGGGGGSGGMIAIEAMVMNVNGWLRADGGGGGCGGAYMAIGHAGQTSTHVALPFGCTDSGAGAYGGSGSYNANRGQDGMPGFTGQGGGGGGGGAGLIFIEPASDISDRSP